MSVVRIRAEILALLSHRAALSRSGLQIIKIPSLNFGMGHIQSKTTLKAGNIEPRQRMTQKQAIEPEWWAKREDSTVLMNSD